MLPELGSQFEAEMRALIDAGAGLPFVFNPGEAFTLLAVLQLALRHPALDGYPEVFARSLAEEIERRLCVTPALREVARRGWDQKFDEPRSNGSEGPRGQ
jgi:hypothetical protein